MDGYLLINKPVGWTSFDVVNKLRGLIASEAGVDKRQMKVGHSGTLDPLASGLLIILVGSYCKKSDIFMKLDKTYHTTVKLGYNSPTDDQEGNLVFISDKQPSMQAVEKILLAMVGPQKQIPPQFSALKVGGVRAYKNARAGKIVELKPRLVNIIKISNIKYQYPLVSFDCDVSSGTYIRSIARDIGQKLGTGAYLMELVRTRIDNYELRDALEIKNLEQVGIKEFLKHY